jgi:D-alanine-D-alanine ligase
MKLKRLHVVVIYNGGLSPTVELPEDRSSTEDLRRMICRMARVLRQLGHKVTILPLAQDLFSFHRKLRKLRPDVVFNQYDDVVRGALYEMPVAALVAMLGYAVTGSSALALGLTRYKFVCANLLQGAGIPIPPETVLVERIVDVERHAWTFPLIVQPCQEDAGIGLDRNSVVHTRKALRDMVRAVLKTYRQPALVQRFLPGREFNVGIIGGRKLRVLPLAEVDYTELPPDIPPIMSYAAKWMENTVEYQKTTVVCPAEVEPELARAISKTALKAFRAVGAWGYSRVDIRLDEAGTPCVLEVNCNASLEEDVALARSAKAAGMSYPQLLQAVIQAAMERSPFEVVLPML